MQYIAKEIRIKNVPENLQREIQAAVGTLTNLKHPNILKWKQTHKDRDTMCVVMEYCEGGDFSQTIARQKKTRRRFSEEQVLDLFVQICMALKYLHDQGIPHKDLKPQNIFLTKAGIIRLDTSGITRGLDSTLARSELQSQYYTPLEILEGKSHDEKSDVWSLGCVLYELCMLEAAFKKIVEELQQKVNELEDILRQMERMHYNTTAGSLTGGVVGATGGILCITGLILAPFTLGASLIVTGVGTGLAVAGGVTGAASNITNMVKQSTVRSTIQNIMDEVQDKMDLCVACLQIIDYVSEALNATQSISGVEPMSSGRGVGQAAVRASRGLAGVAELVRLVNVVNIGRVAAQAARAVRVAEAVTGVLAGLFVALDVYFIANDSREIHAMRREGFAATSESQSGNETENEDASPKSETRKFIQKMREASAELQECVTELYNISSELPEI
ncbi:apolipoprotein L3-like [Megalops cyprinoides]|uniref:apolipoprotein L3-like n=1 Tax=Megalops cyprinoides TaxID=118141 RepID=UPI001864C1F0|nr:apolipoprotein L3-like [Megalops cyprinoides]